jgi:hypothetical protein
MQAVDWAKARIDWPVRFRPGRIPSQKFRVYVVARISNSTNVDLLMRQAQNLHVWPLDNAPGQKFELLDKLLTRHPPQDGEWVVFADDDVQLVRGTLDDFVAIAAAIGLDVAQPSNDRRGYVSHGFTVSRLLSRARETTFVEIGPIFAVSPIARDRLTRTFAGAGMGWGLEQVWYNLAPPLRFGIVDEIRMRHLSRPAQAYDYGGSLVEMRELLARAGAERAQPQTTLQVWPAWRRISP